MSLIGDLCKVISVKHFKEEAAEFVKCIASRAVDFPSEAWTVVGKPSTAGIDIDDETFNFPVGRRAVDAFPMLGMQAMQLLTTAEACHYLLATRKEESMEDFEDPVFFGYIDARST